MTNIGTRLDRLPVGYFTTGCWGALALVCSSTTSKSIYMTSVVAVLLVQAGWFTIGEIARFASVMFFGLALGALVVGQLGDLYGRKTMYQVNLLIYSIGVLPSRLFVAIIQRVLSGRLLPVRRCAPK
jgi:MFS family permease